jgi:hypothetical protein
MNPDTKFLLEEMCKEFAEQKRTMDVEFAEQKKPITKSFSGHDEKWEDRLSEVEKRNDERTEALESSTVEFKSWKPTIESSVQIVKTEVQKLSKHWERAVKDKVDPGLFPPPAFALPLGSVTQRPSADVGADSSDGHRSNNKFREMGNGSVATYTQIPGKGTFEVPFPPPVPPPLPFSRNLPPRTTDFGAFSGEKGGHPGKSTGRLPKLNFPEFTGDNPRLWISRCENYFDMYEVEQFHWIQIASMYFNDAAARWFQSVEHRLRNAPWSVFVTMLLEHFSREQKELLIHQLFHI